MGPAGAGVSVEAGGRGSVGVKGSGRTVGAMTGGIVTTAGGRMGSTICANAPVEDNKADTVATINARLMTPPAKTSHRPLTHRDGSNT